VLRPATVAAVPVVASPDAPPPEAAAAVADPRNRLGRFITVDLIGSGAMGRVWRSWDSALHRWVAIKILNSQGLTMDDLARFRREAKLSAGLDHPNVAPVYDVGESGGRHYIVLKLVNGRRLDDVFRPSLGDLPETRPVLVALRDACRGVGYAHARSVIHRDLKPANLMLDRNGHVFVMDFGLARSLSAAGGSRGMRFFLGTPAFMSPEAARGDASALDTRSDVWSLGATLFFLLSGRPVHPAESPQEQMVLASTRPAPRLRTVRADVSARLEDLLSRALAWNREERFRDGTDLAEAIDRHLVATQPPTPRASVAERVLVVEPDFEEALKVAAAAKDLGLKPEICRNRAAALTAARMGPVALVLLETAMGEACGIELLGELREMETCADAAIVVLTANREESAVARAFEVGADDYLVEPLSPIELKARLGRLLRRR
jgi:CheY-like chemotaxis protein